MHEYLTRVEVMSRIDNFNETSSTVSFYAVPLLRPCQVLPLHVHQIVLLSLPEGQFGAHVMEVLDKDAVIMSSYLVGLHVCLCSDFDL